MTLTMQILMADSKQDLQEAINMQLHLLCLNEIPAHLSIAKPETKGNKFYTVISHNANN